MTMKALFIGGTGTISTETTALFAKNGGELYLLNRGNKNQDLPENIKLLCADINDEEQVAKLLKDLSFDVIADFIAFTPDQIERDYRLFHGKTKQYIFISSASAYQTPPVSFPITESTPLCNPYWQYSRDKIACENLLMDHYRNDQFPVTIVRPSHTYCQSSIPINGWPDLKRMLEGKQVIIPGDGATLWTLTHSRDFAKAFVGLMGNVHCIGDAVHITTDEVLTWNQIYELLASALGVPLKAIHVSTEFLAACSYQDLTGPLTGDKSNNAVFDNSKVKGLVPGFCATIPFRQGAEEITAYYLAHPELQTEDKEYDAWCDAVISAQQVAASAVRNTPNN